MHEDDLRDAAVFQIDSCKHQAYGEGVYQLYCYGQGRKSDKVGKMRNSEKDRSDSRMHIKN